MIEDSEIVYASKSRTYYIVSKEDDRGHRKWKMEEFEFHLGAS